MLSNYLGSLLGQSNKHTTQTLRRNKILKMCHHISSLTALATLFIGTNSFQSLAKHTSHRWQSNTGSVCTRPFEPRQRVWRAKRNSSEKTSSGSSMYSSCAVGSVDSETVHKNKCFIESNDFTWISVTWLSPVVFISVSVLVLYF